jgi:uncharacterized protein (DUF1501 family)
MATTRREFLRTGALGAVALGVAGPLEAVLAAPPQPRARRDPVVVFVNLLGGNDGLNTVVPLAQYDRYRALRPIVGLPREQLVPLPGYQDHFALNPALRPLLPLFERRKVAIVNGVGYPPTAYGLFDHEASHNTVQTGDVSGSVRETPPTGWIGRFLDEIAPGDLPPAVDLGGAPLVLTGVRTEPLSLPALNSFGVVPSSDRDARMLAYGRLQALPQPPGSRARNSQLRRMALGLVSPLQEIDQAYEVAPGVTYPFALGGALRDCAALIAADRGVRGLGVTLGGFDTHSGQNAPALTAPYHQVLLDSVAGAIAAFAADLSAHGIADRVVTVVVSEFGRRAGENVDEGTDHGLASIALVIGEHVRGGVYGDYPDLRSDALVLRGNLATRIDFRSVYATVLAEHFGADPEPILGGDFPLLRFL